MPDNISKDSFFKNKDNTDSIRVVASDVSIPVVSFVEALKRLDLLGAAVKKLSTNNISRECSIDVFIPRITIEFSVFPISVKDARNEAMQMGLKVTSDKIVFKESGNNLLIVVDNILEKYNEYIDRVYNKGLTKRQKKLLTKK
jgi:hypothetical protein